VSGTVGLDDPTVFNRTAVYNLWTFPDALGMTGNAYGGVHAPDVVGNIRVDQALGLFQLSGALHEVNASYNALTFGTAQPNNFSEVSGHPETRWGRFGDGCLEHQEHPDRSGRRHQYRRQLGGR
jgi:hypothetical protein